MRLPNSLRSIAVSIALCGLIVVLVPLWFGQMAISRLRTMRAQPTPVDLPRIDIASTDLATIMKRGTPAIITGLVDELQLETLPDLDGLRRLAATGDVEPFGVKTHRDHSPYFLYRGDYGAEVDHTSTMTLSEFIEFMFDHHQAPGTCTYRLFGTSTLDGHVREIVDEISDRFAAHTDLTPDRNASGLWIGSKGVVTPLHHDAWTGLLFQFHGAKRIRMFSPRDRVNLAFSSPFSPRSVWSRLPGRSADTDLGEFPRFAHATPHDGQLEAGEVLFIPPYWAHEIEALEANISMPYRFVTGVRGYLDPGFLTPAVEIFDSKFVHARTLQK
jgi:hypothetical protein